ncbi:tripartite tricarboxylate transporter substrate binding protein [Pantoea sp. 18069]|uniref:Bug family tripartite tricarboxylate transporter substrate binding protein n=1 Tax=Pantoea sp. 18069 TaxID=2681415 RepID=UPI001356C473|nr:tripartite tricarboxylate transporter substrate-binding protein [Pantoea sp. 18069]
MRTSTPCLISSFAARPTRRGALRLAVAAAVVTLGSHAPAALAQGPAAWPTKPVKIIVGYPPGGSVDQAARIIGDALGPRLGATLVVDNQGGAAGAIAAQRVVSSPADGHTLLVGSSNEMAATGLVNPTQKYDPVKDLTPIGLIATAPVLLMAGPKTGVRTLAEFIDVTRRNPGKFSYGSSGVGSTLHFAGELIKQRAGIFMTHIPYRGTASLTSDLAGATLDFAILSPAAALPFIQSGRLVPLAISSAARLPSLPNVPALGEHPLLKGYDLVGWFAMAAPRNLPPALSQQLSQGLQATLEDPAVRRRLEDAGMVLPTPKSDLATLMRDDMAQYARLVDFAKMKD